MLTLVEQKKDWERQLSITDSTDPYCNRCREEIAYLDEKIEEAKPKKTSKKSSKKSK